MPSIPTLLSLPALRKLEGLELETAVLAVASRIEPLISLRARQDELPEGLGPLISADVLLSAVDDSQNHSLIRVMVQGIPVALARVTHGDNLDAGSERIEALRIVSNPASDMLVAIVQARLFPDFRPPMTQVLGDAGDLLSFGQRATVDLADQSLRFVSETRLAFLDRGESRTAALSLLEDGRHGVLEPLSATPWRIHEDFAEAERDYLSTVERLLERKPDDTFFGASLYSMENTDWGISIRETGNGTLWFTCSGLDEYQDVRGDNALATFMQAARDQIAQFSPGQSGPQPYCG